jgi:hypothetical protein
MIVEGKVTTDKKAIKEWIEERKGWPAVQIKTNGNRKENILWVGFPEASTHKNLQKITWEEFFEKFDQEQLTFLYQDASLNGEQSQFFYFL